MRHLLFGAGQNAEDITDGLSTIRDFWDKQMVLDQIAVATPLLFFDDVRSISEVGDNGVGTAFSNAKSGRNVAQSRLRFQDS